MARTVCKAFSIKLNSIMQRDSGKSKKSTGHLPSLPAHGQKASDTAEKVEFGLGPEPAQRHVLKSRKLVWLSSVLQS